VRVMLLPWKAGSKDPQHAFLRKGSKNPVGLRGSLVDPAVVALLFGQTLFRKTPMRECSF
jgi:hypothetical protein